MKTTDDVAITMTASQWLLLLGWMAAHSREDGSGANGMMDRIRSQLTAQMEDDDGD